MFYLFVCDLCVCLCVDYLRRSEPRRPLTGVDVVEAEVVAEAAAGRDVNSGRVALTPALFFYLFICYQFFLSYFFFWNMNARVFVVVVGEKTVK